MLCENECCKNCKNQQCTLECVKVGMYGFCENMIINNKEKLQEVNKLKQIVSM